MPVSAPVDVEPAPVVGEERTQPIEVRRADLTGPAVAPEREFEHTRMIETRPGGAHAAPYEETAEAPAAPVDPRPAAHARPEESDRVAEPEPEEPHGLGWLLSMSGLGATTPVPEAEAEPVEVEAEAATEVRPQGWFAPALETTEEVTEEDTEEPVAEDVVAEEPMAEDPAAEEAVAEELAAEEPVAEEPVAEELVVDEPIAEEPVVDEPVLEEPVVDEPALEEPVLEEPVLEEPVLEEPVLEEPVLEEPVAEEPALEEPVLEEPVREEPLPQDAVAEPVVEEELPEIELLPAEEPVTETLLQAEADDDLGYDQPFADFQSFGGQPDTDEPLTELIEEPATEPIVEPVTELIVEPPTTLIEEPATEPIVEPPTALIVEPPTTLIVEPPTQLITEPATEPIEEPVTEPIEERATELLATPDIDEPATVVITTSLAGTLPDEETAPLDALITAPAEDPEPTPAGSEAAPTPLPENDQAVGELAPPVPKVRQRRDQRAGAERRRADPEQILASFPWTFDPQTLREQVDEPDRLWDLIDRLTDRLEFAERDNVRAGLLSLRAVVSRVLGELDDALADGREALQHAEASGELRPVSIAQARLAQVLQWRGEFAEADRLYARADSVELPSRVRAEILELAGRSAFEQGRFLEAVNHFEHALDVRQGGDPDLVERIELALDTIAQKTNSSNWGPYPRTRDELLGLPAAPMPLPDDGTGLWGYAAAVEPRYAEVQPFAEGLAWVRRPDAPAWELIDPSGTVVISADEGYLAAGPFAEGLAWVSRQADGGWFAVNRQGHTVVPGEFEEARPFRRGMALIRQDGVWGAIDRTGRVAVPPRWPAFATSLHVGGAIDGFTGDGLAVVDAGDGFGVLDRTGQLVIEPTWAAVVIHPSAFLVRDAAGQWGALSRAGEPLTEMTHPDRAEAAAAIEDEARPVL
ncbi:WG repeat-containing protein [Actinoplanes missouriensis]|uniref:WG repeat-containing protein n=1 Tax=Actinoplanes missouriensis TaxID=1866 RepID=UPI0033FADE73